MLEAVDATRRHSPDATRIGTLEQLGVTYVVLGRRAAAQAVLRDAWKERFRVEAAALRRSPTLEPYVVFARLHQTTWLLDCMTDASDAKQVQELFECYGSIKGMVLRSSLASRERLLAARDVRRDRLWARIRAETARMSNLAFRPVDGDLEEAAQALAMCRVRRRAMELEFRATVADSAAGEGLRAPALALALPAGSVLVDLEIGRPFEYSRADDGIDCRLLPERVLAFVVAAENDAIRMIDVGGSEAIRAAVDAYLGELELGDAAGERRLLGRGRQVRELLWDPTAQAVGDATTVFVTPDSYLARLPFETLPTADERFLLEEHALVYATDPVSLLAELRSAPAPERADSLLVAGGIDYGAELGERRPAVLADARGGGFTWQWDALPETIAECEQVARLFGEGRGSVYSFRGADATEDAVQDALERASVVHLATHGFFEPAGVPSLWTAAQERMRGVGFGPQASDEMRHLLHGHPPGLLAGLVLAGANDPPPAGGDGYLTAEEVAYLDLSRCDLVVLSGCETGVGTVRGGEGMLSLRRAFHEAGARTVVATHWRVRDVAARELCVAFYRHLWQDGLAPAAALRAAKLAVLERQRAADLVDPGAWGAYVLSGSWR